MRIAGFDIGKQTLIIAEIGSNHNGDFNLAKKMIVEAARCGVDAVKFQVYNTECLIKKSAPLWNSSLRGKYRNQFERFKCLEFNSGMFDCCGTGCCCG